MLVGIIILTAVYLVLGCMVIDIAFEEIQHDFPRWIFPVFVLFWPMFLCVCVVVAAYNSFDSGRPHE